MKKIIVFSLKYAAITGLALFCLFAASQAKAYDCTLSNIDSVCLPEDESISVQGSFIASVVNEGLSFSLRDGDGNLLESGLRAEITSNSFEISGAESVYFPSGEINRDGIDVDISAEKYDHSSVDFGETGVINANNIRVVANNAISASKTFSAKESVYLAAQGLIKYGNIKIEDPDKEVTIQAKDGGRARLAMGGDIYSQANNNLEKTGRGGNITVRGEYIMIGNISAAGYKANGSKVILDGNYVSVLNISIVSIWGYRKVESVYDEKRERNLWEESPNGSWKGDDYGYGQPGELEVSKVTSFRAEDILAYGKRPRDLTIQAKEYIEVGAIDTHADAPTAGSDCPAGSRCGILKCDWGELCQKEFDKIKEKEAEEIEMYGYSMGSNEPRDFPWREYYGTSYKGGDVNLLVSGGQADKGGIWIRGNAKTNSYSQVSNDMGGPSLTGMGPAGYFTAKAANKYLRIDGSIEAVGSHSGTSVDISGKNVQIKDIVTNNIDAEAFPEEISSSGAGAGDVVVVAAKNLILKGSISAQGRYAFSPDGGSVILKAGERISGSINVKAQGASLQNFPELEDDEGPWDEPAFEWYAKKGVSSNDSGVGIFPEEYCANGTREYYDGTDGDFGPYGGDGGNVTIEAPVLLWEGGGVSVYNQGGNGAYGGKGGTGSYCSEYEGEDSHVIPKSGQGGAGGKGGNGGDITISSSDIHCVARLDLESQGGRGGYAGYTGYDASKYASQTYGIRHTSPVPPYTCNLNGWSSEYSKVPERISSSVAGQGGNGGEITFSPAPTDQPIADVDISAYGARPGRLSFHDDPYPYYCDDPKDAGVLVATAAGILSELREVTKEYSDCLGEPSEGNCEPTGCYAANDPSQGGESEEDWCDCKCECAKAAAQAASNAIYGESNCLDVGSWFRKGGHCEGYECSLAVSGECRPKMPATPCQDKGFSGNEVGPESGSFSINPDSGSGFSVKNAEGYASFNGANGANGGNGGDVDIDSLLGDSYSIDVDTDGANGGDGAGGQRSYATKPGDGGSGGSGGNAGTVKMTTRPERLDTDGGSGGDGGVAGSNVPMEIAVADSLCGGGFADFNKICDYEQGTEGEGCDSETVWTAPDCPKLLGDAVDEMIYPSPGFGGFYAHESCYSGTAESCRTGNIAGTYGVNYKNWGEEDGEKGSDGSSTEFQRISPAAKSSEKSCSYPGEVPEIPDLPDTFGDHNICVADKCINVDCFEEDCSDECNNDGECEDKHRDCDSEGCCVLAEGSGVDQCTENEDCQADDNNPPKAEELNWEQTGGCEEYPAVELSWTYVDEDNDPLGEDPQAEYEIDINGVIYSGQTNNSKEIFDLDYNTTYSFEKWPWPQFGYEYYQEEEGEWVSQGSGFCQYTNQTGLCTTLEEDYKMKMEFANTSLNCGPNGDQCSYEWAFGDGNTSLLKDPPEQIYPLNKKYTLVLWAENDSGKCYQDMKIDLGGEAAKPPKWWEITPSS